MCIRDRARYFNTNRGKALAISGFGFSVGEIIYPAAVVFLLLTIGWRLTWFSSSIFILIFFGIFFYFIFKINNFKKENDRDEKIDLGEISWRRRNPVTVKDINKDKGRYI